MAWTPRNLLWETLMADVNSMYPLPADYEELTRDGQRQARIAACSLRGTPEERVAAWRFFRQYYLFPQGEAFYPIVLVDSPQFHAQAVYDESKYCYNLYAAPRGFGKSIVIGQELPLLDAVTQPYIPIALIHSNKTNREHTFGIFQQQLTGNARLIDDFGSMKPKAGTGRLWNLSYLKLANGSLLRGYTIGGQKRGGRFRKIYVDDAERDLPPKMSPMDARRDLDQLLCRILMPMMPPRPLRNVFWICTMVSRQSFSWYVWAGADPRFNTWNKRFYTAEWLDEETHERTALWPSLWSIEKLDEQRADIGDPAYFAEYLNQPAAEESRPLHFEEARHAYVTSTNPSDPQFEPFKSICEVTYPESGRIVTAPLSELLLDQFRLITVDYAPTISRLSDFSCIAVMGINSRNRLFLWDLWLGKVRQPELIRLIYQYGRKWLVSVVGVEAVATQVELFESTKQFMRDRCLKMWLPRVVPIKYPGGVSKEDRMAGLGWRFDDDQILLPGDRLQSWPWVELRRQTDDFTYGLELLDHDDALDTVSMVHYTVHGQGGSRDANAKKEREPGERVIEMANQGLLNEPATSFPIGSLLPNGDLNHPAVQQVVDIVRKNRYNVSKRPTRNRLRRLNISGVPSWNRSRPR